MLAFDKSNHGAAINISPDGSAARRTNGFANGIVFTHRPINVFEKITFEIQQQQPAAIWQGALRLGLFSGHQIPSSDLPSCTMEASIGSFYSMISLEKYLHLYNGLRMTVWLTQNHCLNYAINHILRGTLIDHQQLEENNNGLLPIRLVFDLFGNTTRVQLIREGQWSAFFEKQPDFSPFRWHCTVRDQSSRAGCRSTVSNGLWYGHDLSSANIALTCRAERQRENAFERNSRDRPGDEWKVN